MGETSQIVSLWRRAQARGEQVCVATVVHVEGSSYRKPGARMLITQGGERAGSISGGCLEGEISRKAWWLTAHGPSVQRYQSSFEEDAGGIPWGLGCGGTVWVLLERDPFAVLTALEAAQQRGEGAVVPARLRRAPGEPLGVLLGTAGVFPQTEALTQPNEPWTDRSAAGDAPMAAVHQALRERISVTLASLDSQASDADGELPEWFVEYLAPPPRLTIFGAGDDSLPIARFAEELGWRGLRGRRAIEPAARRSFSRRNRSASASLQRRCAASEMRDAGRCCVARSASDTDSSCLYRRCAGRVRRRADTLLGAGPRTAARVAAGGARLPGRTGAAASHPEPAGAGRTSAGMDFG